MVVGDSCLVKGAASECASWAVGRGVDRDGVHTGDVWCVRTRPPAVEGADDVAPYERERLDKSFEKLDKQRQRIVKSWIEKNLVGTGDPRIHSKALTAHRRGQWRYRVGDTNPG